MKLLICNLCTLKVNIKILVFSIKPKSTNALIFYNNDFVKIKEEKKKKNCMSIIVNVTKRKIDTLVFLPILCFSSCLAHVGLCKNILSNKN